MGRMGTCAVKGCKKTAMTKDKYCAMHRARLTRNGTLSPIRRLLPMERLLKKLQVTEKGCWEFMGKRNNLGYGRLLINGKYIYTHRFMMTMLLGKIPKGMIVRHICHNPACCNPAHIRIGSPKDNAADRRNLWKFPGFEYFEFRDYVTYEEEEERTIGEEDLQVVPEPDKNMEPVPF